MELQICGRLIGLRFENFNGIKLAAFVLFGFCWRSPFCLHAAALGKSSEASSASVVAARRRPTAALTAPPPSDGAIKLRMAFKSAKQNAAARVDASGAFARSKFSLSLCFFATSERFKTTNQSGRTIVTIRSEFRRANYKAQKATNFARAAAIGTRSK